MPRGLPRAEGRKFAEARGEGRTTAVTTELLNEASRRPSGQRAAAPFQAAERRTERAKAFLEEIEPPDDENLFNKEMDFEWVPQRRRSE